MRITVEKGNKENDELKTKEINDNLLFLLYKSTHISPVLYFSSFSFFIVALHQPFTTSIILHHIMYVCNQDEHFPRKPVVYLLVKLCCAVSK